MSERFPTLPETPYWNGSWQMMPPGKSKGAKRRTTRPGEKCGFFRELHDVDVIPIEEWDEWLASDIDLATNILHTYDQDGIGSCAAEGVNGCVENMISVQGQTPPLFNPYGMYHFTSGGRDQGSTLEDNLEFARDRGCIRAELWPRSKGFRARPSDEALEDAKRFRIDEYYEVENWEELGSALFQKFAGYAAYTGHAWEAVRPVNKTQLKWHNSWGEEWGDGGYGIINANRVQFSYGIFVVRSVLWVPDN